MSDIIHKLREFEFRKCSEEAVQAIENLLKTNDTGTLTGSSLALANDIMSEFIFFDGIAKCSSKGAPVELRKLGNLDELNVLHVLCYYFGSTAGPNVPFSELKSSVFHCLFPLGDMTRSRWFVKLVTMLIATRSGNILNLMATWLQHAGFDVTIELSKNMVEIFMMFGRDDTNALKDLARLSSNFTTWFLCGIAELYGYQECMPPKTLLEFVADWTVESSTLCTAQVTCNHVTVTPFLGLVRWSVLGPLYTDPRLVEWKHLHLALLESLLLAPKVKIVSAEQLTAIVAEILESIPRMKMGRVQYCGNLLTQIILVLFRLKLISGNLDGLFKKMDELPSTELLTNFKTLRETPNLLQRT